MTAFSEDRTSLTLKELAQKAGFDAATTLRYARALSHAGFLERRSDGRYSLGFEVLNLARIRISQLDVRAHALPIMRRIRDQINETVSLNVRSGSYRVMVEQMEGLKEFRRTGGIGQHVPLHCGAASLVLLAFLPEKDIEEYLSSTTLRLLRDNTLIRRDKMRAALQQIRIRGYAESENERGEGGAGAAAPIYDHAGDVVAALNIAAPLDGWRAAREEIRNCVVAGAAEISNSLGYGLVSAAASGRSRRARSRIP
ncbi:MAG: IclR family transcriptional regulator [Betaproteobacteria bacterium]|nr:IclR family transcriptional regulator [Betaproteobacteria bacterium]